MYGIDAHGHGFKNEIALQYDDLRYAQNNKNLYVAKKETIGKESVYNIGITNIIDKKQIIKLEEDSYFKDLMESITNFLTEYPSKTAFPSDVYKAAYDLVEYATLQFENNNNQIAQLMNEREENIKSSYILREALETVSEKQEGWTSRLSRYEGKFDKNISEGLSLIANSQNLEDENIRSATKMIETKISNLESNLFIEIDIERIEDRSKALSSIGIELADSLKTIPAPIERVVANVGAQSMVDVDTINNMTEYEEVNFDEYIQKKKDGTPNTNWEKRPVTMITKVAIVQALREAFIEELSGMYEAEEMGVNESELDNTPIQVDENETYDKSDIDDAEIVEENDDSGDPF